MVAEAVAVFGSERKASEAVGVDRRTWQRARKAEAEGRTYKPMRSTVDKLTAGVRAARTDPAYPRDKAVRLDVIEHRSGRRDGAGRTITGQQLGLRPGTMRRVVEVYKATGDPEAMARTFVAGVTVGFYRSALAAGLDNGGQVRPDPKSPGTGAGDDEDQGDDEDGSDDDEGGIDDLYPDDDLTGEGELFDDGSVSSGFTVV